MKDKICNIKKLEINNRLAEPHDLYALVPTVYVDYVGFPLCVFNMFVLPETVKLAKSKLSSYCDESNLELIKFRNKDIRFELPGPNDNINANYHSFPMVVRIKELKKYEKFVGGVFYIRSSTYSFYNNLIYYGMSSKDLYPGVSYSFKFIRNNSWLDISNYPHYEAYNPEKTDKAQKLGYLFENNQEVKINKPGHVYTNRRWSSPMIYLGSTECATRFKSYRYGSGLFYDPFNRYPDNTYNSERYYFIDLGKLDNTSTYLGDVTNKNLSEGIDKTLHPVSRAITYTSPQKAIDLGRILKDIPGVGDVEDLIYQSIKKVFYSSIDLGEDIYRFLEIVSKSDFESSEKRMGEIIELIKGFNPSDRFIDSIYDPSGSNYMYDHHAFNICESFVKQFNYSKDEFRKLIGK